MNVREFQEQLPKKRMAAGCLLFNSDGKVLLVNPIYKEPWEIPGGAVEHNESPLQACVREVKEELNLAIQPKRLLCIAYTPQQGDRSESLHFIFDGGQLTNDQIKNITLQPTELSEYRFCTTDDANNLLNERVGSRVQHCMKNLESNHTLYLEKFDRVL